MISMATNATLEQIRDFLQDERVFISLCATDSGAMFTIKQVTFYKYNFNNEITLPAIKALEQALINNGKKLMWLEVESVGK